MSCRYYKYCIVPKCTNTSVKTPHKLFFQVPRDTRMRKEWCIVMKRVNVHLSSQSNRYCCEDHFDLEADMDNYIKFKLVGGKLMLKKGVLPHKFDCQKLSMNKMGRIKKNANIEPENLLMEPIEFLKCERSEEQCSDHLFDPANEDEVSKPKTEQGQINEAVQVSITEKTKIKSTNTLKRRNEKTFTCFQETNRSEILSTNMIGRIKTSANIGPENLLMEPVEILKCERSEEECSDHLFVPANEDEVSKPKVEQGQINEAVQVSITEKTKVKSTNTLKRRNEKKVACFQETNRSEKLSTNKKRRIKKSANIIPENLLVEPVQIQQCERSEEQCSDHFFVPANEGEESEPKAEEGQMNKAVQVSITEKMNTKSTNTPKISNEKKVTCFQETNRSESFTDCVETTSSFKSAAAEEMSIDLAIPITMNENLFKEHMQKGALMAVSRDPQLLIGIPKHSQFCLEHLQNITRLPLLEILVPLRKMRWREPNSMLAIQFGLSESSIFKCFNEAVPKIATCMKEFITFPLADDIRHNVPIPFRQRYSKVTSIIDCFEVQIEKPSDATHQALTWSRNKRCNTIKYLISFTRDGLINFISEGYGGRTTDSTIFEDCGFLDKLSKGSLVLTERGFKNIGHIMEQKGCKLVRPPSVNSNSKPTREEVVQTKRVAALRIRVERSIGKLRHFEMIGPHATFDISYIHLLDDVVVIACGIVNLQN